MVITEIRIKLLDNAPDRLRAFCSVTFDNSLVVRDLKIIEGEKGPFVAMPSRKITSRCNRCGSKNHLRANYCNSCGVKLHKEVYPDERGRPKLYSDIAHPINANFRRSIQERVMAELEAEIERSKKPGYVSSYDVDHAY